VFPAQAAPDRILPFRFSVIPDTSVTIITYIPVNCTFDVFMGPISARQVIAHYNKFRLGGSFGDFQLQALLGNINATT
jgi:hypothetical protein